MGRIEKDQELDLINIRRKSTSANNTKVKARNKRQITNPQRQVTNRKSQVSNRNRQAIRRKRNKIYQMRILLLFFAIIFIALVVLLIKVNTKDFMESMGKEPSKMEQSEVIDTVSPEVSATNIEVNVGEHISYRNAITYTDNVDAKEELSLQVDNSNVDTNKAGTYMVPYSVEDQAGNLAKGTLMVTVIEPITPKIQEVYDLADNVLAEIITEDMDQKQKARAIYDWIRLNVHYINHSEKDSWVQGAYEGLVNGQGDCFVFAQTAKVLLTRAKIDNIDVVKATTNPSHYWNLVDVGDGWYHFDSTPRKDGSEFFLWTDAELEAYSVEHDNCHNFDRSLYPKIN